MKRRFEDDAFTNRDRMVAAALGLGPFIANFDVTSLIVIMPAIGKDLGIDVENLAWIVDAYSIAFTGTLLVAGALADRFGRRRTLILGNAFFLLASLACGLAETAPVFLVARAAQGFGAAFIVTGAFALVAAAFPISGRRARAFGVVGVVSGVAMALGPSLGGILSFALGWRWVFLINVPVGLLIPVFVPQSGTETRDRTDRPLDWTGVVVLTVALSLATGAALEARQSLFRSSLALALCVGLVVLFIIRQRRKPYPLLDPTVFASRPMTGLSAVLLAVSGGYWSVLVFLPLFLMAKFGWTAQTIGVAMLAATFPMLVVPPLGSYLAPRIGWKRLFGAALLLIACGDCALIGASLAEPPEFAVAISFGALLLIGTGAALSHPQLSGAAIALAPPEVGGMASAVTVIARQAGFALGVAVIGALIPFDLSAAGFAWPFVFAVAASFGGVLACRLIPSSS
jgi:MFS family permease